MPNWCSFSASFEGDIDPVVKILDGKGEEFEINEFFSKFKDTVIKDDKFGTYYGNLALLGTKWDVDPCVDLGQESLSVSGQSAWSPPIAGMLRIARHFKLKCLIEYDEGGLDFGGVLFYDPEDEVVWHWSANLLFYYMFQALYEETRKGKLSIYEKHCIPKIEDKEETLKIIKDNYDLSYYLEDCEEWNDGEGITDEKMLSHLEVFISKQGKEGLSLLDLIDSAQAEDYINAQYKQWQDIKEDIYGT